MMTAAKTAANAGSGCLHLPVAPRANTRRRFGEPENPGRALAPKDVLQWLERVLADHISLSGVGISGPGEPLAEPAPVIETLRAVHEKHPELSLSLTTNGLTGGGLPGGDVEIAALAKELAATGLAKVTVLVDAVDPSLLEQLYAWIRPGRRTLPLPEAARALIDAQAQAIRSFREAGLFVTVRMTIFAGINEEHVEDVASAVSALGADLFELAAYEPASAPAAAVPAPASGCAPSACASCGSAKSCGSAPAPTAEIPEPEPLPGLAPGQLDALRERAARYIALAPAACGDCSCGGDILWMEHAGSAAVLNPMSPDNPALPRPSGARVNVAVASSDGLDVDLHLGQAIQFLIFGPREGDGLPSLLGSREAPEPISSGTAGAGDARWEALAATLSDCFAILASSAGARPREVLSGHGLTVLTTETDIQGAVDVLYGGGKKNGKKRIKAN